MKANFQNSYYYQSKTTLDLNLEIFGNSQRNIIIINILCLHVLIYLYVPIVLSGRFTEGLFFNHFYVENCFSIYFMLYNGKYSNAATFVASFHNNTKSPPVLYFFLFHLKLFYKTLCGNFLLISVSFALLFPIFILEFSSNFLDFVFFRTFLLFLWFNSIFNTIFTWITIH